MGCPAVGVLPSALLVPRQRPLKTPAIGAGVLTPDYSGCSKNNQQTPLLSLRLPGCPGLRLCLLAPRPAVRVGGCGGRGMHGSTRADKTYAKALGITADIFDSICHGLLTFGAEGTVAACPVACRHTVCRLPPYRVHMCVKGCAPWLAPQQFTAHKGLCAHMRMPHKQQPL